MPKGMLRWRLRNRIAMRREAMGWTQAVLAKKLGVAESTIAGWEADYRMPSAAWVGKLAGTLRCRPGDLFPKDYV